MKYILLSLLFLITILNAQQHHGHPGQKPNSSYHQGNFSNPQYPHNPYQNSSMNHTHPYRPFNNFTNSSQPHYGQRPPFSNFSHSNSSIFENFTEEELTHYEANFFDSLSEIFANAFNHTEEEIDGFRNNMSYAFNETLNESFKNFPQNEEQFHSFFQDLLQNMSNNSNPFAQELNSFNRQEQSQEDQIENIFKLLNKSTNATFNNEKLYYLDYVKWQLNQESPDLNDLFDTEYNFTLIIDELVNQDKINYEIAELIKMQVHNAVQQKYQEVWMKQEINELTNLKQNPEANKQLIQEKQYMIDLQNQTLLRNKLFNHLSEQFIENIQDINLTESLEEEDEQISELFNNLKTILKKQELHYDIQELYEQLEDELQYLESVEKKNEIRQEAIRALNNSGTQEEQLNQLKEDLEQLIEQEYYEEDIESYQYDTEFENEQKGQGHALIVIIILLIIIIAAVGYYLYVRSKKRSEIIRVTQQSEHAGFFRQIDENVKA